LKKAKQQFWAAYPIEQISCRECAIERLQYCTSCGCIADLYFILEYLRGESGNDPNYFIAATCRVCSGFVEAADWGVKLLEIDYGMKFFMAVHMRTVYDIPAEGIPKIKKEKDNELELA
jgi:hypothetical protein